jgi:hypothetical protein
VRPIRFQRLVVASVKCGTGTRVETHAKTLFVCRYMFLRIRLFARLFNHMGVGGAERSLGA